MTSLYDVGMYKYRGIFLGVRIAEYEGYTEYLAVF